MYQKLCPRRLRERLYGVNGCSNVNKFKICNLESHSMNKEKILSKAINSNKEREKKGKCEGESIVFFVDMS